LLSACLKEEGITTLTQWMNRYLSLMEGEDLPANWLSLFWQVYRLPLLVVLLQFTALGDLLIPAVLGAKGFLFSFSVSAFVRCYQWKGMQTALLLFGLPESIQIVVLFLLAVESWTAAQRRIQEARQSKESSTGYRLYFLCFLLLLIPVLLQGFLAGKLAVWIGAILK
jgi:hypothetical protein